MGSAGYFCFAFTEVRLESQLPISLTSVERVNPPSGWGSNVANATLNMEQSEQTHHECRLLELGWLEKHFQSFLLLGSWQPTTT